MISFEHVSEGFLEEVKSFAVPGPGTEIDLGSLFAKQHPSKYSVISTHMDYVNMSALVEVI